MKLGKLLTFGLIFGVSLLSCEKEDSPEEISLPQADFTLSPIAPVEGDEVTFSADLVPGTNKIVNWEWNFGDENSTTSTELDPTFVYGDQGSYEVTLEVIDASGNVQRTTQTIEVIKKEFPAVIGWEYMTGNVVSNINDGSSAPVIDDNGVIYFTESRGGEMSSIVAVLDQGDAAELEWISSAVGGDLPNAPAIGPDGNIFINAWVNERAINKLNAADGSLIWSGEIGTDVSNNTPAIDSEGNTYHGSRAQGENGGVYSWSPTGEMRWSITGQGAFYAAPVLSADEAIVYFLNTNSGEIWAVNTEDGSTKWEAPIGIGSGTHGPSLSMDADGTIYFTNKTHVVAVTDNGATGSVKWQTELNDPSNSGVVIGPNGDLYTGSIGGLIALDPADGSSIVWNFEDAEIAESVPAVDSNGNIYVGTRDGRLIIVDAEGELEKEFEIGDNVVNSPTIDTNGNVYVEVMDGENIKLVKIVVEDSAPANSAWPMKGQNAKNTSQAI